MMDISDVVEALVKKMDMHLGNEERVVLEDFQKIQLRFPGKSWPRYKRANKVIYRGSISYSISHTQILEEYGLMDDDEGFDDKRYYSLKFKIDLIGEKNVPEYSGRPGEEHLPRYRELHRKRKLMLDAKEKEYKLYHVKDELPHSSLVEIDENTSYAILKSVWRAISKTNGISIANNLRPLLGEDIRNGYFCQAPTK
jgi:hypothetical protein